MCLDIKLYYKIMTNKSNTSGATIHNARQLLFIYQLFDIPTEKSIHRMCASEITQQLETKQLPALMSITTLIYRPQTYRLSLWILI